MAFQYLNHSSMALEWNLLMLENLFPKSFLELLAGGLLVCSAIISLISYRSNSRTHSVKLLAIFCVAALAILSNNAWTYFAALFVIATGITELDFLQTLAAIIRGNKEYFDYKKEALSKQDKMDKITEDVVEAAIVEKKDREEPSVSYSGDAANDSKECADNGDSSIVKPVVSEASQPSSETDSQIPATSSVVDSVDRRYSSQAQAELASSSKSTTPRTIPEIYQFEHLALNKVQSVLNRRIERGVRFANSSIRIEVDGVMKNPESGQTTLFEVKYLRSGRSFIHWINLVGKRLSRMADEYRLLTGHSGQITLVLILEEDVRLTTKQLEVLKKAVGDNYFIFNVTQLY